MNRQGIRLVALHRFFFVPLNATIFLGVVLEPYESPTKLACRVTSFLLLPLNATILFVGFITSGSDTPKVVGFKSTH